MDSTKTHFDALLGREVVLDMASRYVILGKLITYDERLLVLQDADLHDLRDTSTTREVYVVESKRFGIRTNRARVIVVQSEIVSLSALDDVVV